MAVTHLVVVGGGTMGRGIAECAAVRGLRVTVVEISPAQQERAAAQIRASVERARQRGKLTTASPEEVLARIDWLGELERVPPVEVVIEAVPEDEALKTDVLRRLDAVCPPTTLLATNTSSLSIGRLARHTQRPAQVVGLHFFNPVPVMPVVEIVRGLATGPTALDTCQSLATQLGKQAFVVADSPGFVVNRILLPLINEAVFALQEGVGDPATIDALMKLGCNHPMGPLELADFVGLDVCLSILRVLHRELGEPKYRPCPLLVRMVDAGRLGRKSGEGFYRYPT